MCIMQICTNEKALTPVAVQFSEQKKTDDTGNRLLSNPLFGSAERERRERNEREERQTCFIVSELAS